MIKKCVIKHRSPRGQDYRDYSEFVVAYNRAIQEVVSRDIADFINHNQYNVVFGTTGSDARLEKGKESNVELVLFTQELRGVEQVLERLGEFIQASPIKYEDEVEIKSLQEDRMSHAYFHRLQQAKTKMLSPNRMFDSQYLAGSQPLYVAAQMKFIDELRTSEGRKIGKKIRERAMTHADITATGKQQYSTGTLDHYDIDEGIVRYDPKNKLWSVKQGPLRLVQYALVRDKIKLLREQEGDRVLDIPKSTAEAINYLDIRGCLALNETDTRSLLDNYKFFLWVYLLSQEAHMGGNTEITIEKQGLKERLDDLVAICQKQIIKNCE